MLRHSPGEPINRQPTRSATKTHAAHSAATSTSGLRATLSVALFCCAGPISVLVNRSLMQQLPLPITIAAVGMATTAGIARLALYVKPSLLPPKKNALQPPLSFWRVRMPVGLASAGSLAFGNMAYLYLSISFVQMLKALTPVIVMGFTVAWGLRRLTPRLVLAVLAMATGVCLSAMAEGNIKANATGVAVMLLSEVAEALRCVLTENLLKGKQTQQQHASAGLGVFGTMCAIVPATALCLALCALLLEGRLLAGSLRNWRAASSVLALLPMVVGSAALSAVVNFSVFAAINASSSLFVKLLSPLRNVALIAYGVVVYGETLSNLSLFGYAIAISSFALYSSVGAAETHQAMGMTTTSASIRSHSKTDRGAV
tara:strand:- start:253 stop:1368 length:1116 start_codon:yes stop_codon:yes gene_type:complete